jgi:peptidoglycan/LPS O-acetylase OafA/YrhL
MLAIGCFVALVEKSRPVEKLLRFSRVGLTLSSLLLFYFLVSIDIHSHYVIAPLLVGLTSGMFVLCSSSSRAMSNSRVGFMQLLIPLRLMGLLSYELYLFHLIFWGLFYKYDIAHGTAWLSTLLPMAIAISICLIMQLYLFEPARRFTYQFLTNN